MYKEGILTVRIIHGKGTGKLVICHAVLKKMPEVKSTDLDLSMKGDGGRQ